MHFWEGTKHKTQERERKLSGCLSMFRVSVNKELFYDESVPWWDFSWMSLIAVQKLLAAIIDTNNFIARIIV